MANGKKSIIVYADWIELFDTLTDDEAGKLIKHFFKYVNDLSPVAPDRLTELSFIPIKQSLKRDLAKWENTLTGRSIAGKASAESKKHAKEIQQTSTKSTNVEFVQQNQQVLNLVNKLQQSSTKSTDSVSVSVNVSDTIKTNNSTQVVPTSGVDYLKFINFFNSIAKRNFKVTDKVKAALNARLKTYDKKDILKAIENAHKDQYHIENGFKYLTPEYILREDKVEMFLNITKKETGSKYNHHIPQVPN